MHRYARSVRGILAAFLIWRTGNAVSSTPTLTLFTIGHVEYYTCTQTYVTFMSHVILDRAIQVPLSKAKQPNFERL